MYVLLAGFVRRASHTIERQRVALSNQIRKLTEVLAQNQALHDRVRESATRATALNERFLRRISSELHDGPAQDLALVLLRLDSSVGTRDGRPAAVSSESRPGLDPDLLQQTLRHALQELRAISAGLRLPELERLTLAEVLARVVHAHEQRTGTNVRLEHPDDIPRQASLPVKITLYRVIQEALSNAYRHGGGVEQRVRVGYQAGHLTLEVSDQGPGFEVSSASENDGHIGLVGMRERVQSLGGTFGVESGSGRGTKIFARLALQATEGERA
jgi:signal transduction histidine kinase